MELKPLDVLIAEILAENDVTNKDRYSMKPSASDVSEWLNSSAGIDTNKQPARRSVSGKGENMKGFKQWYVRMVKPEYADRSYRELVELFGSEYRNTGSIELPGRMTKTGNPAIW